jgi:hypothetical protein
MGPLVIDPVNPLPDHLLQLISKEVGAALRIGTAAVDVRAFVAGQRCQQALGKGSEKSFDRSLIRRRQRPGRLDRDAQPLADAQQVIGRVDLPVVHVMQISA